MAATLLDTTGTISTTVATVANTCSADADPSNASHGPAPRRRDVGSSSPGEAGPGSCRRGGDGARGRRRRFGQAPQGRHSASASGRAPRPSSPRVLLARPRPHPYRRATTGPARRGDERGVPVDQYHVAGGRDRVAAVGLAVGDDHAVPPPPARAARPRRRRRGHGAGRQRARRRARGHQVVDGHEPPLATARHPPVVAPEAHGRVLDRHHVETPPAPQRGCDGGVGQPLRSRQHGRHRTDRAPCPARLDRGP